MTEIDPMVRDFRIAVEVAARNAEYQPARERLAMGLTERLQASTGVPSNAPIWTSKKAVRPWDEKRKLALFNELLDLVRGPEPQPKGKRIYYNHNPWAACHLNRCQDCQGVSVGSSIVLCPHDCHKEDATVQKDTVQESAEAEHWPAEPPHATCQGFCTCMCDLCYGLRRAREGDSHVPQP